MRIEIYRSLLLLMALEISSMLIHADSCLANNVGVSNSTFNLGFLQTNLFFNSNSFGRNRTDNFRNDVQIDARLFFEEAFQKKLNGDELQLTYLWSVRSSDNTMSLGCVEVLCDSVVSTRKGKHSTWLVWIDSFNEVKNALCIYSNAEKRKVNSFLTNLAGLYVEVWDNSAGTNCVKRSAEYYGLDEVWSDGQPLKITQAFFNSQYYSPNFQKVSKKRETIVLEYDELENSRTSSLSLRDEPPIGDFYNTSLCDKANAIWLLTARINEDHAVHLVEVFDSINTSNQVVRIFFLPTSPFIHDWSARGNEVFTLGSFQQYKGLRIKLIWRSHFLLLRFVESKKGLIPRRKVNTVKLAISD